ncbi:MAG: WS/DGAT domain-containing protein [Actinomycetia bacterium]|nr:WS/DGAT domain-containing protein [Actinomycetes bacterium]
MATTPMSVQDALWLTMDRPNNLMVVDGAMVLSQPVTLDDVKDVMLATAARFPVFKRKPLRRGTSWSWIDDPAFDVSQHVRHVTLEGPADMAALQRFMAERRSKQLNKRCALWETFLVSPLTLDDGSQGCAVVSRFHHAIADGVRLTQVMLGMCEAADGTVVPRVARNGTGDGPFDPMAVVASGATETARVSAAAVRSVGGAATGFVLMLATSLSDAAKRAGQAVTDPVGSLTAAPGALAAVPGRAVAAATGLTRGGLHGIEEGVAVVRHPDRLLDALEILGVEDHRTLNDLSSVTKLLFTDSGDAVWTGKPGAKKAVAWSPPLPLSDVMRTARANGATMNDVMLAAIAAGLRRYLALHDDRLDEVVWMVPVNLKPFADNLPEELGNYFALIMLPMPLDGGTPKERLTEMRHRMQRIKHSDEAVLTFGLQRGVSLSPSRMAFFLTNFFANKAVGVLSNVPGPTGELRYAGVPVRQVVGFAPCSGNQPMTATIFTYNGTVTVGFATDARLVPDPDVLVDLVVDDLAAMRAAVGRSPRAPRKATKPAKAVKPAAAH